MPTQQQVRLTNGWHDCVQCHYQACTQSHCPTSSGCPLSTLCRPALFPVLPQPPLADSFISRSPCASWLSPDQTCTAPLLPLLPTLLPVRRADLPGESCRCARAQTCPQTPSALCAALTAPWPELCVPSRTAGPAGSSVPWPCSGAAIAHPAASCVMITGLACGTNTWLQMLPPLLLCGASLTEQCFQFCITFRAELAGCLLAEGFFLLH